MLTWTHREKALDDLYPFNQMLAVHSRIEPHSH
jgi:hypothetical protein